MTDRSREFLAFYREYRFRDQLAYYQSRVREFEAANAETAWVAGIVMVAASAAAFISASGSGPRPLAWRILAVGLPALGAAISSYQRLFAFERLAKLFEDAATALVSLGDRPAAGDSEADVAAYVSEVERIFAREQGQWGQLTAALETKEQDPAGLLETAVEPEKGSH